MTTSTSTPRGLGRRKTAIAQAQLIEDAENRTVNGIALETYFPTAALQHAVLEPLKLTSQVDTYGFRVKVAGGGKASQAGAVKLAIARALLAIDDGWRKQLKDTGQLTRDPRMKERKKYGLKRARRAPQFSKR